jgi:hypothetical protein
MMPDRKVFNSIEPVPKLDLANERKFLFTDRRYGSEFSIRSLVGDKIPELPKKNAGS